MINLNEVIAIIDKRIAQHSKVGSGFLCEVYSQDAQRAMLAAGILGELRALRQELIQMTTIEFVAWNMSENLC